MPAVILRGSAICDALEANSKILHLPNALRTTHSAPRGCWRARGRCEIAFASDLRAATFQAGPEGLLC